MTENVVSLHTGRPIATEFGEPVESAVELCARLLDSAKSGNLRGLAVVFFADGNFTTDWAHDGAIAPSIGIGAGIVALTWRYGRAMCSDDFAPPPPPGDIA